MWDWLFQFVDPLERTLEVAGRTVWFAAPESVILHKLRFLRDGGGEKHLRDIRGMPAVSGGSIDLPAIDGKPASRRNGRERRRTRKGGSSTRDGCDPRRKRESCGTAYGCLAGGSRSRGSE